MKIVLNKRFGGFCLSGLAYAELTKRLGKKVNLIDFDKEINRQDRNLVEVVELLGSDASGRFAELEVVEIPDDVDYKISEYDGLETVYFGNNLGEA